MTNIVQSRLDDILCTIDDLIESMKILESKSETPMHLKYELYEFIDALELYSKSLADTATKGGT